MGRIVFRGRSPLRPPLPGKAIKPSLPTSPKALSLRFELAPVYREAELSLAVPNWGHPGTGPAVTGCWPPAEAGLALGEEAPSGQGQLGEAQLRVVSGHPGRVGPIPSASVPAARPRQAGTCRRGPPAGQAARRAIWGRGASGSLFPTPRPLSQAPAREVAAPELTLRSAMTRGRKPPLPGTFPRRPSTSPSGLGPL